MSLRVKVICTLCFLSLLLTVALLTLTMNQIDTEKTLAIVVKSQAILSRLESVRSYIASQGGLESAIAEAQKNHPDGILPKETKSAILKQVPIFAAMKVGAEGAEKERYRFRVFSDEPRSKENLASPTELEILRRFEADPKLDEIQAKTEESVVVYRPVRLSEKQGCLSCHGDPKNSPWGNGKDILGHQMENWKDQKLHGVFAIISDLNLAAARAEKQKQFWVILGTSLALTFSGLALAYWILRGPLIKVAAVAEKLGIAGKEVSSASGEVSKASLSLNDSSTQAASSLQETSATMDLMSNKVNLNATSAQTAYQLAVQSKESAEKGYQEFSKLVTSIQNLKTSSETIKQIITVIDDIAFQTNLLALNAAVEAARAGEQGKGFAVVADAVRALAQRSAQSAREITELIQQSVDHIENGNEIVIETSGSLKAIVESIERAATLTKEIAEANEDQARDIMSVNKAVSELDKVTQTNAANAEQTSAASEELSAQAQQLQGLVLDLHQVIDGKTQAS